MIIGDKSTFLNLTISVLFLFVYCWNRKMGKKHSRSTSVSRLFYFLTNPVMELLKKKKVEKNTK